MSSVRKPSDPEFLTPKQVSELTGIGLPSLYAMLEAGRFPGRRVGRKRGRWLISRTALYAWVAGREEMPSESFELRPL